VNRQGNREENGEKQEISGPGRKSFPGNGGMYGTGTLRQEILYFRMRFCRASFWGAFGYISRNRRNIRFISSSLPVLE